MAKKTLQEILEDHQTLKAAQHAVNYGAGEKTIEMVVGVGAKHGKLKSIGEMMKAMIAEQGNKPKVYMDYACSPSKTGVLTMKVGGEIISVAHDAKLTVLKDKPEGGEFQVDFESLELQAAKTFKHQGTYFGTSSGGKSKGQPFFETKDPSSHVPPIAASKSPIMVTDGYMKLFKPCDWHPRRIKKWYHKVVSELENIYGITYREIPKNKAVCLKISFDGFLYAEVLITHTGRLVVDGLELMAGETPFNPSRSGEKWGNEELLFLRYNFESSDDPATMARKHQRTVSAIVARLEIMGLLKRAEGEGKGWAKPEYISGKFTKYYLLDGTLYADLIELKKHYTYV